MKVLQINKAYPPVVGGVEKVVSDIGEALASKVDMRVLVANDSFKAKDEHVGKVRVRRSPSLGKLFSMPIAPFFPIDLFKHRNVDVMHFHFPFPIAEVSSLLFKTRAKKIVTWHSDIVRQKSFMPFYKPALLRFLRSMDKVVVTSPNMMESSEILKEFRDKCLVIPLGVDTERFELTGEVSRKADEIRKRYSRPLILFMGRLVYYKGVEYLVRAMEKVDAQLVIGGDGPLRNSLESLTRERNLKDRIEFVGFISDEDLSAYYHACEFFVLPSIERSEAFGIVQIEAQACGKPVISTDLATGVPYANLDGVTGITVPNKDAEALSIAMNELLQNREKSEKLGSQARIRVMEEFTVKTMSERYYDLYFDLTGEANKGDRYENRG